MAGGQTAGGSQADSEALLLRTEYDLSLHPVELGEQVSKRVSQTGIGFVRTMGGDKAQARRLLEQITAPAPCSLQGRLPGREPDDGVAAARVQDLHSRQVRAPGMAVRPVPERIAGQRPLEVTVQRFLDDLGGAEVLPQPVGAEDIALDAGASKHGEDRLHHVSPP